MNYKISPISFAIHHKNENAIYGESTLHLTVIDEAAGPYISLKTTEVDPKPGIIELEIEQLEQALKAAKQLVKLHEDSN